ncbi:MAG: hypothetical protein WBI82_05725 [Sphaerochaeta sp.]
MSQWNRTIKSTAGNNGVRANVRRFALLVSFHNSGVFGWLDIFPISTTRSNHKDMLSHFCPFVRAWPQAQCMGVIVASAPRGSPLTPWCAYSKANNG